jgi:UDP-N-acetylmuramoyl-L-alanyl-D-glutamate--2,6-diaminopimelate ligase
VDSLWGTRRLQTRLIGNFNVYNWLAAIATGLGQGLDWEAIERATSRALPVRGRAQRIEAGQPFTVLVDFAHTPWALATVLRTCGQLTRGRVIVVCGHPGERFVENRPVLGAVAVQGADLTIVTSDDPYDEPPEAIIESIVAGAIAAGGVPDEHFFVVPDRRQAIRRAVQLAQPGDLVLIAGRGHLRYRVAGAQRTPFDDAQVARQILQRLWSSAAGRLPPGIRPPRDKVHALTPA